MLSWIQKDTNNAHRTAKKSKADLKINKTKDPETGELADDPKVVTEIIAKYIDSHQSDEVPGKTDWESEGGPQELTELVVTGEMMDTAMKQTSASSTLDPYGISATDLKSIYSAVKTQLISVTAQSFEESHVPSMIKKVNIIILIRHYFG